MGVESARRALDARAAVIRRSEGGGAVRAGGGRNVGGLGCWAQMAAGARCDVAKRARRREWRALRAGRLAHLQSPSLPRHSRHSRPSCRPSPCAPPPCARPPAPAAPAAPTRPPRPAPPAAPCPRASTAAAPARRQRPAASARSSPTPLPPTVSSSAGRCGRGTHAWTQAHRDAVRLAPEPCAVQPRRRRSVAAPRAHYHRG